MPTSFANQRASASDTEVGVAIPAWRSGAFLIETIESVLRQTHRKLRIVISIDGDDTETADICRPYLDDERIEVVHQTARLGWVANSATALAAAAEGVPFACIVAHDDVLHEEHFSALVEAALEHPGAAVVFPDFEAFGTRSGYVSQDSVVGHPLARQLSILLDHYNGLAWHGLVRSSTLARVAPMNGNDVGDFAVDTVWFTRLAVHGDLIRVPRPLLRKRYHSGNVHEEWAGFEGRSMMRAWTVHCLDVLAEAWPAATSPSERRLLAAAARIRLLRPPPHVGPFNAQIRALGRLDKLRMYTGFQLGLMGIRRRSQHLPERPNPRKCGTMSLPHQSPSGRSALELD